MQLNQLHIVGRQGSYNIQIDQGRISHIEEAEHAAPVDKSPDDLFFTDAIAFPGLINSHDHLDFNLFPQLRSHIYNSYTQWGTDIHLRFGDRIDEIIGIPAPLRIRWGIYKNLLNGVTTVVNHGKELKVQQDLITIDQQTPAFHSVSGERHWRLKLIDPFTAGRPLAIHIGEGITPASAAEIDALIRWNLFSRPLIGIHGVAMNERQAASFHALVWCPESNHFLYGTTAPIDRLKKKTSILFGTDSTLTASWNLWEHLRLAREQMMLTDTELFDALTHTAAGIWRIKDAGSMAEGQWADIVIARPSKGQKDWDAFYTLDPENILLVLHHGMIRLFDEELSDRLTHQVLDLANFFNISVNGRGKYIQGDLPGLMNDIRKYHPSIQFPISNG